MPGPPIDAGQRKRILDELGRILQSPHFRTSRRSQQFLGYVVEHTLDGSLDWLKERAIGMALFDRAPDYDTGEDAAVRVAANEVRKRLAQYYLTAPPHGVRIALPPGGYHAEFEWTSTPGESHPQGAALDSRKWRWVLAALFATRKKPFQIRIGYDVSFADLRESAAVLIGAYSNRWTMQVNADYRFAFERYSIVDRQQPGRAWRLENMRPGYRADEDYLLISPILTGYSGEPLVMAAGITHAGTQAAGELLTQPAALEEMMQGAPRDWARKNLQIVLHCKVVGTTPRPPRVVASHFW